HLAHHPHPPTLYPYTTLFRSNPGAGLASSLPGPGPVPVTISVGGALAASRRHEAGAIISRHTTKEPGVVRLVELDVATGQGMVSTRIGEAPAGDIDHERVLTLARFGLVRDLDGPLNVVVR